MEKYAGRIRILRLKSKIPFFWNPFVLVEAEFTHAKIFFVYFEDVQYSRKVADNEKLYSHNNLLLETKCSVFIDKFFAKAE